MAEPIWRDYDVQLGTADSVKYRVQVDGNTIYAGRAYKRPGQTYALLRLNNIAADYIQGELPDLDGGTFSGLTFPLEFAVEKYSGGTWVSVEDVEFYMDWSYDASFDPTGGLTAPIDGEIAPGQWFFYTTMSSGPTVTVTIVNTDGTTINIYAPISVVPDFNADFNNDFARNLRSAGAGTVTIDMSLYPDAEEIQVEGHRYRVAPPCNKYVLYYRNAFGGWDSLIVKGVSSREDELSRYTRGLVYNNSITYARGEETYAVEVSPTFRFHTQILTDDEASRMHHLLNSPDVYVHDLDSGNIWPLVLTNSATPWKTFVSEGRTMYVYEITARLGRYRVRR